MSPLAFEVDEVVPITQAAAIMESYSKGIGPNTTLMLRADSEYFKYIEDISGGQR